MPSAARHPIGSTSDGPGALALLTPSLLLLSSVAFAEEAPGGEAQRLRWRAAGLPYLSGNSSDGLGVGVAAEAFARPRSAEEGYHLKLGPYWYTSLSLAYVSWGLPFEDLRAPIDVMGRIGYRGWDNLLYAGVGGRSVSVDHGEAEGGNALSMPFATVTLERPIEGTTRSLYGGVYARLGWGGPEPGGLLDQEEPPGVRGGFYGDAFGGVAWSDTDRWPLPTRGLRAEVDMRLGLSGTRRELGESGAVVGVHGEAIRWWPLGSPRLVLGARAVLDATTGPRPYFDLDVLGGRERDELGFDQALAGYGASRSRGPGLGAFLVELRLDLFAIPKPDLRVLASVFAEEAWLAVLLATPPHLLRETPLYHFRWVPLPVDPEDTEMLEDLVLVAVQQAMEKAKELSDSASSP